LTVKIGRQQSHSNHGARFGATSGDPGHPPATPDFARQRHRHAPPLMRQVSKLRGLPAEHHGGICRDTITGIVAPGSRPMGLGLSSERGRPCGGLLTRTSTLTVQSRIGCACSPQRSTAPVQCTPHPPRRIGANFRGRLWLFHGAAETADPGRPAHSTFRVCHASACGEL
jgi:hypothetical protein